MNVQPQYEPFKPVTNTPVTNAPKKTSDISMYHRSLFGSTGDAQACTGTVHVQTMGRYQPLIYWTLLSDEK